MLGISRFILQYHMGKIFSLKTFRKPCPTFSFEARNSLQPKKTIRDEKLHLAQRLAQPHATFFSSCATSADKMFCKSKHLAQPYLGVIHI